MTQVKKDVLRLVIACGGDTNRVRKIVDRSVVLTDAERIEAEYVLRDIEENAA